MAEKKEEKKGKGEQEFAADVMETMLDWVWIADADGKTIDINPALEKGLGYKKEEMLGRRPPEFFVEKDVPRVVAGMKEVFEKGAIRNWEGTMVAKDGKEIPVILNSMLIKDPLGKPIAIYAVLRDITELKCRAEDLEKAEVYIEVMGDALMVLDPQRKVIKVNKAAVRLWGYDTPEEMLRLTFETAFPEKEHEKHYAEMKTGIETGTVRPFESLVLTKDGKEITVMISGTAVRNADGKLLGFVGIFRDITELKKTQEELQKKINELEEFSKIAVERELDMKRLEEELERLKGKR